jgi:protease IV
MNQIGRRTLAIVAAAVLLSSATIYADEVSEAPYEPWHAGPWLGSVADPYPLLGGMSNPAAAALVEGPQLGLYWASVAQGGSLGTPFGPLSLAFGAARVSLVDGQSMARTNLDIGLDFGPAFKAGFTWHHTYADGRIGPADPISAGLLIRPSRWLSLGLTAFNMSEEPLDELRYGSGASLVRFGGGLSVRPGTERLRVDLSFDMDRKANRMEPQAGLAGTIWPGLELALQGRYRHTDAGSGFGAGATLTLSTVNTDLAMGYGWLDGRSDYFGAVRFSSVSEPSRFVPGKNFVVLDMPVAFAEARGGNLFGPGPETLLEFRQRLRMLSNDPEVTGVFITFRPMATGWAQAQELAASLQELKGRGKKVVAYLLGSSNQAYFLAAHADHILINPAATLFLTGIHSRLNFYADLLAKIGIKAQFASIGAYKSFPEKFERNEPSPAYREAHVHMLDRFYSQLVDGIAAARGIESQQVKAWVEGAPYTAGQALAAGLVGKVASRTDLKGLLSDLGYSDVRLTTHYPLRKVRNTTWGSAPKIAVLVLQGSIVEGRGFGIPLFGKFIGSDATIKALKEIGADPSIDGVLVRIDSPGGSALASERMHAQLKKLATTHPVVVSIGNVAASGGYYLAVAAPEIFLSSGSVTGSIGIWFGKVVATGLLDKLGIQRTTFRRGENAGLLDVDRTLTPEEIASVAERLKEVYDLFVKRVSQGRGIPVEKVETVAQGRVWTGADALDQKLADHLGGSLEALDALRVKAEVSSDVRVQLVFYPRQTIAQQFSRTFMGGSIAVNAELVADVISLAENFSRTHLWALDPWSPTGTN